MTDSIFDLFNLSSQLFRLCDPLEKPEISMKNSKWKPNKVLPEFQSLHLLTNPYKPPIPTVPGSSVLKKKEMIIDNSGYSVI